MQNGPYSCNVTPFAPCKTDLSQKKKTFLQSNGDAILVPI